MCCEKEVEFSRIRDRGQYALRHVLWRGEPDLPCVHGPAGGQPGVDHDPGLSHHRRWPAPAGRGSPGHQPKQRPVRPVQQSWAALRHVLHLRPVPDHRAFLRHPPLRHHVLHRGSGADLTGGPRQAFPAAVLGGLLRRNALLLPAAGKNFDLDR